MSTFIDNLIDAEAVGHQGDSLDNTVDVQAPAWAPDDFGGTIGLARGGELTLDQLIDCQVIGHTGPSLNGFTPVDQRGGLPGGLGALNDQPWQSGPANFSPGVVPSEEVGTGKPPGWVAAHMPVVQGVNPTRSSYAYQGAFADGQEYFGGPNAEVPRNRSAVRVPAWQLAFEQPGQQPIARQLTQWPGSAIIEVPDSFTLSELLGRVGDVFPGHAAWGVQ